MERNCGRAIILVIFVPFFLAELILISMAAPRTRELIVGSLLRVAITFWLVFNLFLGERWARIVVSILLFTAAILSAMIAAAQNSVILTVYSGWASIAFAVIAYSKNITAFIDSRQKLAMSANNNPVP